VTVLEQELAALREGFFPQTPDLAPAVRARVEAEPARRLRYAGRGRRALVVALALVAAAIGAAFAVPDARSTILHWFGIGGVTVERVEKLPPVHVSPVPDLGERVSLETARRRVGFPVVVPPTSRYGSPDAVYVGHFEVDEVTLLYGRPDRIRLLLTEVDGRVDIRFAGKLVGPGTRITQVVVAGRPALWIEGAPHFFYFLRPNRSVVQGTLRLARNTLLWQDGGLVLRLEGAISLDRALELARSLR
jgi:hypothetical protein